MENKDLILFAIGGSGVRFMRSLIFQLASGLKLKDTGKIKIIIIDADKGNGNLEQLLILIDLYSSIRKELYDDSDYSGSLFLHDLSYFDSNQPILSPISDKVQTIESIIDYSDLADAQRGLVDLLLTNEELSSNLQIGFEGRPNMGTIGLQRLDIPVRNSRSLEQLMGDNPDPTSIVTEGGRFFIISSMFGGMGSSGMPMLVQKFSNKAFKSYKLGCLSYMPYYKIINGEGTTDSKHFIPRTKIAFSYYKEHLKSGIDAIYYIGDDMALSTGEIHSKGGKNQLNKAHYVEFFSVSALVHFCENADTMEKNGKEFGISFDDEKKANATDYEELHKKYQILLLIARYYIDHFINNYDKEELAGIKWAVEAKLSSFSTKHKTALSDFFKKLIEYNDEELNKHSAMAIIKSKMIPENVAGAIPYPSYISHTRWLGKEKKYDDWSVYNTTVITDKGVKSTKHIPRLLSVFENSFTIFHKERFK